MQSPPAFVGGLCGKEAMWILFKIVSFFWLLASTYMWPTSLLSPGPLMLLVNALMILCLSMLPVKIRIDGRLGLVIAAIVGLVLWSMWIDGPVMGFVTLLQYMPVLYLIQLPYEYLKDLLGFSTKWLAILLIPGLLLYWVMLVIDLPSFGQFVHPIYKPYDNYIFYIKTTFDYGLFERFNAFFLEPGHLAMLCSFMMLANKFRFMECKWLFVLALCVVFSFSLAGYLLSLIGFILVKINSVPKAVCVIAVVAALVVGAQQIAGGDNALNELIVSRLEYDESKGITGNNRFYNNTDFEYEKAIKKGDLMQGVADKANMELVGGAGFKIYILKYGLIGVALALLFYLSLIPANADYRYTISYLIVLALCFMQRSYPYWYSWMFPYITGIYIAKYEKELRRNDADENNTEESNITVAGS